MVRSRSLLLPCLLLCLLLATELPPPPLETEEATELALELTLSGGWEDCLEPTLVLDVLCLRELVLLRGDMPATLKTVITP